jgi:hypothetical protein
MRRGAQEMNEVATDRRRVRGRALANFMRRQKAAFRLGRYSRPAFVRFKNSEATLHTNCRTLLETFRLAGVELIKIIRSIG